MAEEETKKTYWASPERRRERLRHREMRDGRLVSTIAKKHGLPSVYAGYGCRCEPCTEANDIMQEESRARRVHNREVIREMDAYRKAYTRNT